MVEIIVFCVIATALDENSSGYPAGDKHGLLLFIRQLQRTESDFLRAASMIEERGWTDINLLKSSRIAVEKLNSIHPYARESYQDALSEGFAAIVFSVPVK